jgi:hypothetical protein
MADGEDSLFVEFEEHGGWLVGGTAPPAVNSGRSRPRLTWLSGLSGEQTLAFRDALAGFYKWAGVDLVREQLAAALPPGAPFDVTEKGLVVWPVPGVEGGAILDPGSGPALEPEPLPSTGPVDFRALSARALVFGATPVLWDDWARTWEFDAGGAGHVPLLPPEVRLLPPEGRV